MVTRRYRYNRSVEAHNKGDVFEADPKDPILQSLLGAGYADPVYEPETGEDDGTVRREPVHD